MIERVAISLSVVALAAALAGCPDNPQVRCDEACPTGTQCEARSRTCVATARPRYTRPIPGRSVRIASQGSRIWMTSVDPSDGGIVVTELERGIRDARLLATPPRVEARRVALAASAPFVAIAWLSAAKTYELAWRELPGEVGLWRFATIETEDDYTGTEDFDLAVGATGRLALVFRDRNRTTRALMAGAPDSPWILELVDDGDTTADGVTCPESLRAVQPAIGVGYDPDVVIRSDQTVAAYYDADCGDLRLARRGNGQWSVTVIDSGDNSIGSPTRGLTGRWPSIAYDAAGSLAVAYHDVSRGQLMFAAESDGLFRSEVVDAGFEIDAFSRERKNLVGAFASLSLDASGAAAIVYFDATSVDLQIAQRAPEGSEWSRSTLVANGAVGFSAGQVTPADGRRYVVAEELVPSGTNFESNLVFVEADR